MSEYTCLPGCATDHAEEGPLDGRLCLGPAVEVGTRHDGERIVVAPAASRTRTRSSPR